MNPVNYFILKVIMNIFFSYNLRGCCIIFPSGDVSDDFFE